MTMILLSKLFSYLLFTFTNNFITFRNEFLNFIISFHDSFLKKIIIHVFFHISSELVRSQYKININLIETSLSSLTILKRRLLRMVVVNQRNIVLLRGLLEVKIIKFGVIFKSLLNFLLLIFLLKKAIFHIFEPFFEKHFLLFFHSFRFQFLDFFLFLEEVQN